jgi:hypothetical protein
MGLDSEVEIFEAIGGRKKLCLYLGLHFSSLH